MEEPPVKMITGKETKVAYDKVQLPKIAAYFEDEDSEGKNRHHVTKLRRHK